MRKGEKIFISGFAVAISFFHLYTAAFGMLETQLQRSVHISTLMALTFLIFPLFGGNKRFVYRLPDYAMALLSLASALYMIMMHERILTRAPWVDPVYPLDIFFGVITTLFVLESCRRIIGPMLTYVAIVFLGYAFLGPYFPSMWAHSRTDYIELIDSLYMTTEGIFGIPLGASATFIFLFVLFGAFLEATKTGQFIIDFAIALVGKAKGGPAKVAVIASGLFGTISGASAANVYGTGTFTIPLMKRIGYQPYFAGAVEAAASTGGQIMPPVMGTAAFIIAEVLGIEYLSVCVAAIIPAILYFYSVGFATHLEALRLNLAGVDEEEVKAARRQIPKKLHLFISLIVLIVLLLMRYSPYFCAFWAIITAILISFVLRETRLTVKGFLQAMERGARNAAMIAVATATAGIIVGVATHTGLGFKFMTLIVSLAKGHLVYALFFSMMAAIILGMGMPTAPAYIIVAVLAAPSLIELKIDPIVAHMYVFMFAILSAVTPPVAVAAYAGANLAKSPVMKTGFTAWKLALIGFIIPYMFIYSPSLLAKGSALLIARTVVTAFLGVTALGVAIFGWLFSALNISYRFLYFLGALSLIYPSLTTDAIGLAIIAVPTILEFIKMKKKVY
jgi:TRAP transporter 4TM/12TM fusion protein